MRDRLKWVSILNEADSQASPRAAPPSQRSAPTSLEQIGAASAATGGGKIPSVSQGTSCTRPCGT